MLKIFLNFAFAFNNNSAVTEPALFISQRHFALNSPIYYYNCTLGKPHRFKSGYVGGNLEPQSVESNPPMATQGLFT